MKAKKTKARDESSSNMLRVRMSSPEYRGLAKNAEAHGLDVSEYVRRACQKFEAIDNLYGQLHKESERRSLTSFECNVFLLMYPELFLDMGGVELAKEPGLRLLPP